MILGSAAWLLMIGTFSVMALHYEQEETAYLEFPCSVEGTSLIAQYLAAYEGPYMEDGTNEHAVDIAAIVLENSGEQGIEFVTVTLCWENGEYVFEATSIPPQSSILVLEKSCQTYRVGQWTRCYGNQKLYQGEWNGSGIFAADYGLGELIVTNLTEDVLKNITVYHKAYLSPPDIYVGGVSYETNILQLMPGESVRIMPTNYAVGGSKITRIIYTHRQIPGND